MKKALLITSLFVTIYSISVAKSDFVFKENCTIVLCNSNWFTDNSSNNIFKNRWFNDNSSNNNWLFRFYDTNKNAKIPMVAKGELEVYASREVSANSVVKQVLLFKMAILKKGATKSEMFSENSYKSIAAEVILEKCEPGDKIVLFLMDNENYTLSQNDIEVVEGGC
jgi:hypothetical protein